MPRRAHWLVGLAIAVVVAACSPDDADDAEPTPAPIAPSTAAPTTTAPPTAAPDPGEAIAPESD
ncbi:MAG TPA: hypothetical protein VK866_06000, partial [Acidimicrobiales bacterium]|nr:hypothetical protein [Acidimicrobiales bacterium]